MYRAIQKANAKRKRPAHDDDESASDADSDFGAEHLLELNSDSESGSEQEQEQERKGSSSEEEAEEVPDCQTILENPIFTFTNSTKPVCLICPAKQILRSDQAAIEIHLKSGAHTRRQARFKRTVEEILASDKAETLPDDPRILVALLDQQILAEKEENPPKTKKWRSDKVGKPKTERDLAFLAKRKARKEAKKERRTARKESKLAKKDEKTRETTSKRATVHVDEAAKGESATSGSKSEKSLTVNATKNPAEKAKKSTREKKQQVSV